MCRHDLDELLVTYFGDAGSADRVTEVHAAGLGRLKADFAAEAEPGKRIALWLVLSMVGAAPALRAAFPNKAERCTARTLSELLAVAGRISTHRLGVDRLH